MSLTTPITVHHHFSACSHFVVHFNFRLRTRNPKSDTCHAVSRLNKRAKPHTYRIPNLDPSLPNLTQRITIIERKHTFGSGIAC